jgi:hypothetical protein
LAPAKQCGVRACHLLLELALGHGLKPAQVLASTKHALQRAEWQQGMQEKPPQRAQLTLLGSRNGQSRSTGV